MKRFLLLALPLILLTGCMSKKEICARWASGQKGYEWEQTRKKLGLKRSKPESNVVAIYCNYYEK